MKEIAKYDNWFKILSISVIVIVVCVFTLTVSNTHLAKGTYGATLTTTCGPFNKRAELSACIADAKANGYDDCTEKLENQNDEPIFTATCTKTVPDPATSTTKKCPNITIGFNYSQGGSGITCNSNSNGEFDDNCLARARSLCSQYSSSPGQSCYNGDSGDTVDDIISKCESGTFYCIEGYSHGCNCGTNCGGETPTNPPSKSSEPSKSSSPSKDNTSCFDCNGEYVWTNNPGSNCEKITSITSEDKCVKTSCYKCVKTNATEYLYATSESNAKSITDANSCSKTDDKYCKENIIVNPPTGTAGIIVAWLVGLSAIVYSFWYFKKNSAMK